MLDQMKSRQEVKVKVMKYPKTQALKKELETTSVSSQQFDPRLYFIFRYFFVFLLELLFYFILSSLSLS